MWRPATRNLTGTNDVSLDRGSSGGKPLHMLFWTRLTNVQVPLANKRRFGLPEEGQAPGAGAGGPPPPPHSSAPGYNKPPSDIQFFNGRVDRDDRRGDDRGGRDDRRDDRRDERPRDDRRSDDRYDRDRRDDRRSDDRYDRDRGRDERPRDDRGARSSRWDDDRTRGREPAPGDGEWRERETG